MKKPKLPKNMIPKVIPQFGGPIMNYLAEKGQKEKKPLVLKTDHRKYKKKRKHLSLSEEVDMKASDAALVEAIEKSSGEEMLMKDEDAQLVGAFQKALFSSGIMWRVMKVEALVTDDFYKIFVKPKKGQTVVFYGSYLDSKGYASPKISLNSRLRIKNDGAVVVVTQAMRAIGL